MGTKSERPLKPELVIGWLAALLRSDSSDVFAGAGDDDCAVIKVGRTTLVVSADFLNATPIAEQLGLADEHGLGRLAVAATLSDLLGSGASPKALLAGVTVPHGYPEARFKRLMRGMKSEAMKWGVPIVGGDTKLGRARTLLTCGIGVVESVEELFVSSRARVGDVIMTSGYLGTCAAATLVAKRAVSNHRPVPRWAKKAITVPDLPVHPSRALAKLKVAHGGIDISDGFSADLRCMCSASGVGALIDVNCIPVRDQVRQVAADLEVPPWVFSLASGGDFQFLVTVPEKSVGRASRLGFSSVGRITRSRRMTLRDADGRTFPLPSVGHVDRPRQQFVDEIAAIVNRVAGAC